jgi:hypothetical protein
VAPLHHLGQYVIRDVNGMFQRISSGGNRITSAIRAIRMDRDALSVLVRHLDGRLHFVAGEGLLSGHILVTAGGAIHLDYIHTSGDLFPNRL